MLFMSAIDKLGGISVKIAKKISPVRIYFSGIQYNYSSPNCNYSPSSNNTTWDREDSKPPVSLQPNAHYSNMHSRLAASDNDILDDGLDETEDSLGRRSARVTSRSRDPLSAPPSRPHSTSRSGSRPRRSLSQHPNRKSKQRPKNDEKVLLSLCLFCSLSNDLGARLWDTKVRKRCNLTFNFHDAIKNIHRQQWPLSRLWQRHLVHVLR